MKLVFYSVVLNQHQAPLADELWNLTGHQYYFVELLNLGDAKGGVEDYSKRPYLIRAWESKESFGKAMNLAREAECCVFSGVESLPFEKERMRHGLLSFDMGERWLKYGWKSLASPRLLKWLSAYYLCGWRSKPIYKLCLSGFAAEDQNKLGTFKNKCYKFGYFTTVSTLTIHDIGNKSHPLAETEEASIHLMWCARYLALKHPEIPVLLAKRLNDSGYKFHLNMYGDGEYRCQTEHLIGELNLGDNITVHGNVANDKIRKSMEQSDIFLLTSDRHEGWGAVANESLSCGCVLVASDAVGSSPYLIKEGYNGFMYHSSSPNTSFENPDIKALDDLTAKIMYLFDHKEQMRSMQKNAKANLQDFWSPRHAAESLLQLISDLQQGRDTSIKEGPCSKA